MVTQNQNTPIYRKGFGLKKEVADTLANEYRSGLVEYLRKNNYHLQIGELTFWIAKEFGFCYGVDRAVDYAYETAQKFPDKTIYITTEIIHNPRVNRKLKELGFRFLSGGEGGDYTYDDVTAEDVVLLPAFGASVEEMDILTKKGCILVDTTCGSVMNVWRRVERNSKDGYTSIIHGKYYHEETVATSSRALQFEGGHYVIVRNEEEAQEVCDYIRHGGDNETFLKKYSHAVSPGFDPDQHLQKVGIANQTTMLSSESMKISKMAGKAMEDRYGLDNLKEHFRAFDTICSATQERQDAIIELGEKKPDVIIVVGGYNSSNTNHLCEIGLRYAPTYHISEIDCILSVDQIRHKPFGQQEEIITDNWLPEGPVTLGVTAGASTPDKVVGEAVFTIASLRGYDLSNIALNGDRQ